MKDAVATMGDVLPEDAGGRDAVHVAVISARCEEKVYPGQDVGFLAMEGRDAITSTRDPQHIGIVDPFIKDAVFPGDRFWLYLYPRTITGLSHRWSHPSFDDDTGASYSTPSVKIDSERWLRDWIDSANCPGYEEVVAAAISSADRFSETVDIGGSDAYGDIPNEFWAHLEVVTGRKFTHRPGYFSCSC